MKKKDFREILLALHERCSLALTLDYFTKLQIFTHDVREVTVYRPTDGGPAMTISIKGRISPVECVSLLESVTAQFPDTGHILSSVRNATHYNTANIIIRETG